MLGIIPNSVGYYTQRLKHQCRHIHARLFYVRDLINEGIVRLNKVNTEDNRVDLVATYKDAVTFKRLLGVCKPQPPD